MNEASTLGNDGCLPKITNTWRTIRSNYRLRNQVIPIGNEKKDCEFLFVNSKIRLRVLHVSPVNVKNYLRQSNSVENISKRSSLSEEYWFSRNKPFTRGNCNCSFRRSIRYSFISKQSTVQNSLGINRESTLSVSLPPTKIVNIETFVERLIQDTFFEAFQQYYMTFRSPGNVNLAFENTEDEVVLRKVKQINTGNTSENAHKIESRGTGIDRKIKVNSVSSCVHRKAQNKPVIFLMHGIGTSAEIWTYLIKNFVNKGYEVIAPDMLGHGFSSAPNKASCYNFNNLLLQAISVFDYYVGNDEKKKTVLIGHSYGCSLITALYPHRASQISGLILISGGGPTPLAPPVRDNNISQLGWAHNLLYPLLYCGLKRSFFYLSRGKNFKPYEENCGVPRHILNHMINGQKWLEGDAAFHRRIMVPTLLVHGLHDKQVTLVQECEMERTIPRAFLEIIPNAGHLPMVETPEHLTHMIMCFLDMWS